MLQVFRFLSGQEKLVPAVAHIDRTARIQSLDDSYHGMLRPAVQAFRDATGIPMLCNTSLNDRGEPIIESFGEAVNFCIRRGVGVLYVDGERFAINLESDQIPDFPEPRATAWFEGPEQDPKPYQEAWLARGIGPDELFLRHWIPELRDCALDERGIRRLKMLSKAIYSRDPGLTRALTRFRTVFDPPPFASGDAFEIALPF
jgi:hypothetical protein